MSSGNGMELRVQETGMEVEMARMGEKCRNNIAAEDGGAAAATETVRWERFLPKMVVRVLLVEADDSTRQIISALLRKCSYKGWFDFVFIAVNSCLLDLENLEYFLFLFYLLRGKFGTLISGI